METGRDAGYSQASSHKFRPRTKLNPKFNLYGKYGKNQPSATHKVDSALDPRLISELNDQMRDAPLKDSKHVVSPDLIGQLIQLSTSPHSELASPGTSNRSSRQFLMKPAETMGPLPTGRNHSEMQKHLVKDQLPYFLNPSELAKDVTTRDQGNDGSSGNLHTRRRTERREQTGERETENTNTTIQQPEINTEQEDQAEGQQKKERAARAAEAAAQSAANEPTENSSPISPACLM